MKGIEMLVERTNGLFIVMFIFRVSFSKKLENLVTKQENMELIHPVLRISKFRSPGFLQFSF